MSASVNLTPLRAFLASMLVVGLPYWRIPYAQVSLPDAVWGWPLLVSAGLAGALVFTAAAGFWRSVLWVAASVPAAVMARVLVEGVADPSSHSLWPFELILAAGPGLVAGLLGALAGMLCRRLRAS
jgi:hypothetical protein